MENVKKIREKRNYLQKLTERKIQTDFQAIKKITIYKNEYYLFTLLAVRYF